MKDKSNKRICQACGKKNTFSADFCIECGKKLPKFIIPFSDTIPKENDTIKADKEKPILPFADINKKQVEIPGKNKIQKNKKVLSSVKDSSVNDIKKQDVNSNRRICKTCGNKNPLDAEFCITCGIELPKFIIPFSDTIPKENDTIKADKEKPILPFADINKKQVDVKDSSVNDIKKQDVNSNRRICQTCGNKNLFNAKFCITCGTELPKFTTPFADDNSPKNNKIMNNVMDSEKTIKISDEINENDPSSEGNSEINPLNAIKKANELLQIGAITEEEFEIIKNKYIEKI